MHYLFFVLSHSLPTNFYCVVVQFFGKELICMCKNVKLLCCAAYILVVSICLSCYPNLWFSDVFSAKFCSFRKNSANPDISRKNGSASWIRWKIRLRGLTLRIDPLSDLDSQRSECRRTSGVYARHSIIVHLQTV